MPSDPAHRIVAADAYRVPPPFRPSRFAATNLVTPSTRARPTAGCTSYAARFLDAGSLESLAPARLCAGQHRGFPTSTMRPRRWRSWPRPRRASPTWLGSIAGALQRRASWATTSRLPEQRRHAHRLSRLARRGFPQRRAGHWSRCLFWILALDVTDVEFVMPHAGLQLPWRPATWWSSTRPWRTGCAVRATRQQVLESSFRHGDAARQIFLTGEIPLTDAQWAALGVPWLPVEEHEAPRRARPDGGGVRRPQRQHQAAGRCGTA
jgi:hypothetical protein